MSTEEAPAPRRIDQPRPGFFVMKLVRRGWAVPCSIAHDEQTGIWTTVIDTDTYSAIDPVDAHVFRIWLAGREIEHWQFLDLVALRERMKAEDPSHPCLNPRKAIDPMRLPPRRPPPRWPTI